MLLGIVGWGGSEKCVRVYELASLMTLWRSIEDKRFQLAGIETTAKKGYYIEWMPLGAEAWCLSRCKIFLKLFVWLLNRIFLSICQEWLWVSDVESIIHWGNTLSLSPCAICPDKSQNCAKCDSQWRDPSRRLRLKIFLFCTCVLFRQKAPISNFSIHRISRADALGFLFVPKKWCHSQDTDTLAQNIVPSDYFSVFIFFPIEKVCGERDRDLLYYFICCVENDFCGRRAQIPSARGFV